MCFHPRVACASQVVRSLEQESQGIGGARTVTTDYRSSTANREVIRPLVPSDSQGKYFRVPCSLFISFLTSCVLAVEWLTIAPSGSGMTDHSLHHPWYQGWSRKWALWWAGWNYRGITCTLINDLPPCETQSLGAVLSSQGALPNMLKFNG